MFWIPICTSPVKRLFLYVKYIYDSLLLGETFQICFENVNTTVEIPNRTLDLQLIQFDLYTNDHNPWVCDRL